MKKLGRSPDHLKILPGVLVVVGDTAAEAQAKRTLLDSLVHPDSGLASLSAQLGHDVSHCDLDGPLPEIPESNESLLQQRSAEPPTVKSESSSGLPSLRPRHLIHDRDGSFGPAYTHRILASYYNQVRTHRTRMRRIFGARTSSAPSKPSQFWGASPIRPGLGFD